MGVIRTPVIDDLSTTGSSASIQRAAGSLARVKIVLDTTAPTLRAVEPEGRAS